MDAAERYDLIMRNVEEIVTDDELRELLKTKEIGRASCRERV